MESTADGRAAFQARQSRSAVKNFQSWRVPKDRILKDTFTFSGTHCRVSAKIWQQKKKKKYKNIRDDAFSCHCTSAKRNPFTASLTFHDSNIGCLNSPYSGIFKYREALNSASLEPRLLRYNPEARLASLAIARGRLYFQSLPKRRKATVISSALRSSTSYRFLGEVYLNSRTPRRFIRTSGARLSLFLQFSSRGNAIFGVTSRVIRSALHRGKTKSRHEMRRLCGADRVAPVFGSLSLSLFLYSSVWDDPRIEIARTGPSLISAVNPSDTLFRNFDLLGRCTASRSTRDNVTLGEAAAIRYDSIASDKEAFQFDRLCEVKFPIEEDRRSWDFSIHGTSAKDVAQYTGRAKKSSRDRSAGDSTWENKRRRKFIMYDLLHLLLLYYYY